MEEKLCDWVRAEVSSLACLAVFPYPDFVELVHCLLHDFRDISQDASLEVSLIVRLHSDAGTCKVRAAHIHLLAVKDQHLEVDSRTKHSLQAVIQDRILVEVFPEVRPRLLCMNEPHLHTFSNELGNESQERFCFLAHLNVKVFYVSSPNPKRLLHGLHSRKHLFVMVSIGDIC